MANLIKEALIKVTENAQRQIEYETRAAYRMGYEYVHVYSEPVPEPGDGLNYTLKFRVLHSNTETPPKPPGLVYNNTYKLTE